MLGSGLRGQNTPLDLRQIAAAQGCLLESAALNQSAIHASIILSTRLVAFIVNSDCSYEIPRFPVVILPRERLFVIALAMKLDHFPTTDDPCIRNGNKAEYARRKTWTQRLTRALANAR
jgi:hypothetical protein